MARKSAASAKPKVVKAPEKTEEQKWEELEKIFEDAKWTYIETVKVQVKAAKRVDNYLNLRELAMKFDFAGDDIKFIKELQSGSVKVYEQVQAIAESFKFEDFTREQVPDLFEELMPQVDDIVDNASQLIAAIAFMSITPYGNNLIQMHNLIMQEMNKLGLKPKED